MTPGQRSGLAAGATAAGRTALLALALLPLVVVPGVLFPFVVPRAAALRVAVLAAAAALLPLLLLRSSSVRDGRDPFLLLLAGYAGWSLVAAVAGEGPWRSVFGDLERMEGVVTWGLALLLYALLRCLFRERDWRRFAAVLLASAAAVSVYALLQLWGGLGLPGAGGARAEATLGSPGYLAAFLLLAMGFVPWLWRRTRRRAGRVALAGAVALAVAVFLLTGSRAAIGGAALAGGGGLALWAWHARGGRGALAVALGLGGLLAVGLWTWAGTETGIGGLDRLLSTAPAEKSLGSRFLMWGAGLGGALDHLVGGVGPENFRLLADQHLPAELYRRYGELVVWDRAHNALVEALTTRGLPGLLLYVGMWGALVRSLVAARREGRLSRAEATALGVSLGAYGVYLLFWFEDLTSLAVWIALAAFVRHVAREGEPLLEVGTERKSGRGRLLLAGVGVVVVGATAWTLAGRPLLAARSAGRAAALEARPEARTPAPGTWAGGPDGGEAPAGGGGLEVGVEARILEHYRRALTRSQVLGWKVLMRQIDRLARLSAHREQVVSTPRLAEEVEASVRSAAARMDVELRRDPRNARVHLKHSQLLRASHALTGRRELLEDAVEAARRAVERAPARVVPRLVLAATLAQAGRPEEALGVLEAAEARVDGYGRVDAYFARAHLALDSVGAAQGRLLEAFRLGYAPRSPDPTLRVGDALRAEDRSADEAELYASHLAVRQAEPFGSWAAEGVRPEGRGRKGELRDSDLPVLDRLPPALLRAARPDAAGRVGGILLEQLARRGAPSEVLRHVIGFVRDVEAGRTDRWRGARSVLEAPSPGGGTGDGTPDATGRARPDTEAPIGRPSSRGPPGRTGAGSGPCSGRPRGSNFGRRIPGLRAPADAPPRPFRATARPPRTRSRPGGPSPP